MSQELQYIYYNDAGYPTIKSKNHGVLEIKDVQDSRDLMVSQNPGCLIIYGVLESMVSQDPGCPINYFFNGTLVS